MPTLSTFMLTTLAFAIGPPVDLGRAVGIWEGALAITGGMSLKLVMHIERAPGEASGLKATMDSPDQGATGIPVGSVAFDGQTVTLEMPNQKARYQGKLESDGAHITGTFTQMGTGLTLALHRVNAATPVTVPPQTPEPPFPYDSVELTVPSVDGVQLSGTLTHPNGAGPFRLVVLLPGSGPHDRDETIFGHKPFAVLADALTRRGLAVFRFDARGVAKSTGNYGTATTYDFVKDALATLAFLKKRPEIDAHRMGFIGHSEGSVTATLAAAQSHEPAFVVLLGVPGLPGEQIILLQGQRIAQAMGMPPKVMADNEALQKRLFAVLKANPDNAVAEPKLRAMLAEQPGSDEASVQAMMSPWFRTFVSLDPRPALAKVHVPVLALIGEHDLQVPPKENLPELRKALAHNPAATVRELPGLNHLFQTTTTGLPAEYKTLTETFAPLALSVIGDWLVSR